MSVSSRPNRRPTPGQGMVEFALSLPILLLLVMGIVEMARLLHAFLAVENAARFAIRYAISREYNTEYCDDAVEYLDNQISETATTYYDADTNYGTDPLDCQVPTAYGSTWQAKTWEIEDLARLPSIRDAAKAGGAGIAADHTLVTGTLWDTQANRNETGWFYTTICSSRAGFTTFKPPTELEKCTPHEDAGGQGESVIVMVHFNHPLITPLITAMWKVLPLRAQREGIVEQFNLVDISGGGAGVTEPTKTPTITQTRTITNTPTETATITPTNFVPCTGSGVAREVYTGINGSDVVDLINAPLYPQVPNITSIESSFEAPSNITEAYGQRMRALLCVPVDGVYTFWIASDDGGSLRLNTADKLTTVVGANFDTLAAGASEIASVSGYTGSREWNKYASQQSTNISLDAGYYYIEALMKEGGGADNLAIAMRDNLLDPTPSNGDGSMIISSGFLHPPTLNATITPTITLTHTSTSTSTVSPTPSPSRTFTRTPTVTPTPFCGAYDLSTATLSSSGTRTVTWTIDSGANPPSAITNVNFDWDYMDSVSMDAVDVFRLNSASLTGGTYTSKSASNTLWSGTSTATVSGTDTFAVRFGLSNSWPIGVSGATFGVSITFANGCTVSTLAALPTSTPTRTSTASATITNTATVTHTPTITQTFTVTSTFTASPTITHTPTITNTFTRTSSPTNTFTSTITNTPTRTSTVTNTATITQTFTRTPTVTNTITRTPTITNTITRTPTITLTPTITQTPTRTPVPPTATSTSTRTHTPVPPTATHTFTNTNTPLPPTATHTFTITNTPLPPTATRTYTPVPPTATRTHTPIPPTATHTFTNTNTPLPPTATDTRTFTPSPTNSPTVTNTATVTNSPTATRTHTPTITSTPLPPTATFTPQPPTPTRTRTPTEPPIG